jgi:hypothetical protein
MTPDHKIQLLQTLGDIQNNAQQNQQQPSQGSAPSDDPLGILGAQK